MILILDTAHCVSTLAKMAREFGESPEFFINIVQELLERMQERSKAELLLRGFVINVKEGKYLDCSDGTESIESFYADALAEIGQTVLEQLEHLRAYEGNYLPYRLYLPDTNHYPCDIMLVRYRTP